MKVLSFTCVLFLLLFTTTPATEAIAKNYTKVSPARARTHVALTVTQKVLGIDVAILTALYDAKNLATGEYGTILNANQKDVVVQAGDVIWLNAFLGFPFSIYYTVTEADIASGIIRVAFLS
ncbi:hypothetical protein ECE50_014065 [Chitinophaga sp. Mgbs1]|uniref:Uncharacterized protein n=1 Tax=Chitinophaga solisilvae TaxID=1233460 RepID=A0A9Q5D4T4_9BACT|nr:hypothetical protein [Chitinophaga solisilvae]